MIDVAAAQRQARSVEHVEHRPWPIPAHRWAVGQTWDDLLFAHWRVPADVVRARVPAGLGIEEHDGSAWAGITAFRAGGVRLRGTLPLPLVSSFAALDTHTFVRAADGMPGIWSFSLDLSRRTAVEIARRVYKLPCFHARISLERSDGWTAVECARLEERGRVLSGQYRPVGDVFAAEPGSLEAFLTERYCLYAADEHGALHRADIHHDRLPLQRAETRLDLTSISPVELDGPPACHFASRGDVVIWPLEPVR